MSTTPPVPAELAPDAADLEPTDVEPADLDSEDAFGHPVLPGPLGDEPWADGYEDDVDV